MSGKINSYIIGICIILSRLAGLLREILLARYLGASGLADIFRAAIRIPNFLQNLLGEGVLSAAFIPSYQKLRVEQSEQENLSDNSHEEKKLALHTLRLLLYLLTFILCIGMTFPEYFVSILAPGFPEDNKQTLAELLQIIFPGTALLVISAWCLSILNSHSYFALSYSAPLAWNFMLISCLVYFGGKVSDLSLVKYLSYAFLLGSSAQLLVQLPKTLSLTSIKNFLTTTSTSTSEVLKNIVPVIFSRGVVQVSAYLDTIIASFLAVGSLSILSYAQALFLLPFSVFGMSIAAAELPSMSSISASSNNAIDRKNTLALKIVANTERILFFVIPTIFAFIILGQEVIWLVFSSKQFKHEETQLVWLTLIMLSIGLIPSCLSRLYSSALYSLQYHKLVTKISVIRVVSSLILSLFFCFHLFPILFDTEQELIGQRYLVLGIALASGISSWIEFTIIKFSSHSRMGEFPSYFSKIIRLILSGVIASVLCFLSKQLISNIVINCLIFSLSYLGVTYWFGFREFNFKKFKKRFKA